VAESRGRNSDTLLYTGGFLSFFDLFSISCHRTETTFYDPDDVVGYPLKSLNDEYRRAVDRDQAIRLGPILARTPVSHVEYFNSGRIMRPIAERLARLATDIPQSRRGRRRFRAPR